jgi:uridylate kinase
MNKVKLRKIVVIALGGSIVFPEEINWQYLKKFNALIRRHLKGRRFVIVVGGGKLCRMYLHAAKKVKKDISTEDKDWLGIHATRSNAHLLRTIFEDIADPVVVDNQSKIGKLKYPVTIASGWRPGWSTDYIACVLAKELGALTTVIAGKPDYVYDKDPVKYKSAKKLENLTWPEYRKLIPGSWTPGFSSPVDPVAAKFCQEHRLDALVIDGRQVANFEKLLKGESFVGTQISDN